MELRPQERCLSRDKTEKIKRLLAATDLNLQDIALRMGCAKSTIVAINRKYNIRLYNGRRNQWELTIHQAQETLDS